MRKLILGVGVACWLTISGTARSDGPEPTCTSCPGTYISGDELLEYLKKAVADKRTDQQVRDVDIGKAHVAVGIVHRGKLDAPLPSSVAEHDQVSEIYHVMDGSGTLVGSVPTSSTKSDARRMTRRCAV